MTAMDANAATSTSAASSLTALLNHRAARTIVGLTAVALFLTVWQIVGANEIIRSDLISYPTEMAQTLVAMTASGELGTNVIVSLQEFVQGFVPAILIGIAIGTGFALSRRLRSLFEPLFVALNTSPIIAFVPIVVVWFGVGTQSKAVMVFLASVIPIVINTMTGIVEVQEFLDPGLPRLRRHPAAGHRQGDPARRAAGDHGRHPARHRARDRRADRGRDVRLR